MSADATDVWRSSEVVLYETSLIWKSKCPASGLNISAALCWKLHEHLCTPSPSSELTEAGGGQHLVCIWCRVSDTITIKNESFFSETHTVISQQTYNTSAVDKHPQMCIRVRMSEICFDSKTSVCRPIIVAGLSICVFSSFLNSSPFEAAITSPAPSRLVSPTGGKRKFNQLIQAALICPSSSHSS